MEQEYRQPIAEAMEKAPDVPEETTADASEIKAACKRRQEDERKASISRRPGKGVQAEAGSDGNGGDAG